MLAPPGDAHVPCLQFAVLEGIILFAQQQRAEVSEEISKAHRKPSLGGASVHNFVLCVPQGWACERIDVQWRQLDHLWFEIEQPLLSHVRQRKSALRGKGAFYCTCYCS